MASQLDQTSLVPYSHPNKKTCTATDTTYMPEDVIERILTFLPFKKLCNLAILSKRYRHSWKSCRDLSFDTDFARNLTREECRRIVEKFFNRSDNSVADRFRLHYDAAYENNIVRLWVGKAIRMGIKELELDLTQTHDKATIDYDLIDVGGTLQILKLSNCELNLPPGCNGLRHLKEMTLQKAMSPPLLTDSIFSNCVCLRTLRLVRCALIHTITPFSLLLHTLVLKDCADVRYIQVNCPNLRKFHYRGKMMDLRFDCVMRGLSDVVLDIPPPRGFHRFPNRNQLLERLASVETLSVTSIFLEGLCARFENTEFRNMEFFLPRLREFHLIVEAESFLNPSDVAVFIHKCPRIQKLFVDLGRDAFGRSLYWDEFGKNFMSGSQTPLQSLKYVKIKGFAMREPPLYLAKFFLKNAIHLHRLILVKARLHYFPINYNAENLRWEIKSNARIHMYEYRADTTALIPHHFRSV